MLSGTRGALFGAEVIDFEELTRGYHELEKERVGPRPAREADSLVLALFRGVFLLVLWLRSFLHPQSHPGARASR